MSQTTGQKARKTRSAVLSVEGLEALESGVVAAWKRDFPEEKLTGEVKAEVLGVSSRTASKILKGGRADVATLEFVFRRVDVEWNPMWGVQREAPLNSLETAEPWWNKFRYWGPVLGAGLVLGAWFYSDYQARSLSDSWDDLLSKEIEKGFAAYGRGDYKLAERICDETEETAKRFRDGGSLSTVYRLQADLKTVKGDFEGANASLKKAIGLRDLMDDNFSKATLYQAMGINYSKLKDWEAAHGAFENAIEGYREMGDPIGIALIQRDQGVLAEEQGRHREAKNILLEARKALAVHNKKAELADIDGELAMIELNLGNRVRAKQMMWRVLQYWQNKDQLRWIAKSKLRLGLIEGSLGNKMEAKRFFMESCKGYSAVNDLDGLLAAESSLNAISTSN